MRLTGEPRAFVYMLASQRNGTLYTGSTTELGRRVWEHRQKLVPGFTSAYGVTMLVWFEPHETVYAARLREYQIKTWRRAWKIALIEAQNPHWRDLYEELTPL
jgi:putative endonuclease